MISKDDLLYFLEVSNTLNFSRAAERIGISQPSLSAAIKRLENLIGAELFIRHKKGVTITKSGNQLLAHAKQLLQYWEMVKSRTLSASYEPEGCFTIGSHPALALFCFSGFLPKLLKKHPKLEVQLELDLSRKIVDRVMDLTLDLGIVANPIKHPSLIIQKLFEDEVMFWHGLESHPMNDLFSGEAIIICNQELLQTQWLLNRLRKKKMSYSRILNCHDLEVIADLTVQGCGVGILPGTVAMRQKKLKPVPNMMSYMDEICLVYRPENKQVVGIQEIVLAIKKYFGKI